MLLDLMRTPLARRFRAPQGSGLAESAPMGSRALLAASLMSAAFLGCDVYDTSLLGPQGGSTSTSTSNGGAGAGSEGGSGLGPSMCEAPGECEGIDNECGTRTCEDGLCGVDAADAGVLANDQTPEDCLKNVCDGSGAITTEADDSDVEDDNQDCTDDSCEAGAPTHQPKNLGTSCTGPGNAKVCNAVGVCVECVDGGDCPLSNLCTETFTCAAASCTDLIKSPGETDVDCGGLSCPGCENGEDCLVDGDCLSGDCGGNPLTCQESCTDGVLNQDESAVDCGGICPQCDIGIDCDGPADCVSGVCTGAGVCGEYQLLISEARARGPGAGTDDFIEIYNPLNVPVVMPLDTAAAKMQIATRSDAAASYTVKHTFNGEVIGAHRHFLLAGSGYTGATTPDEQAAAGLITDKVSIVLRHGATTIDTLCMYFTSDPFDGSYTCEGAHFLYSNGSSNIDRSFERLPGGAAGNQTDTNDNLADFLAVQPSTPQNLASPAAP